MTYGLPTTVSVDGQERPIRTDFRVILEILEAVNDVELEQPEKLQAMLTMFYPDWEEIVDVEAAVAACSRFIDMDAVGDKPKAKGAALMDWEHDFEYIIAPVNRVLGFEARAVPYDLENNTGGLHWWTFLAAYMEMGGDCLMSQIVHIRDKQAHGKPLDKQERQWLRRNRNLVELRPKFTSAEEDLIKKWT
jgi:hypothetical protein